LSREQVACLISQSFLGFFSSNFIGDITVPQHGFNTFDISNLYHALFSGSMVASIRCIINYFNRISNSKPVGDIRILRKELVSVNYSHSEKPITNIKVLNEKIEDIHEGSYHGDFANMYIGGGTLTGGCVQEEILFVIKPECLVSMLLCSRMESDEAIIITGCERFSTYSGYGQSFKFSGNYNDPTPFDNTFNCLKTHIIAIDAIDSPMKQFNNTYKLRDINKEYAGLFGAQSEESGDDRKVFVTGNWGCGAFGGDLQLKAVEQIIATTEANFDLIYTTFGKEQFKVDLEQFVSFLKEKNITVKMLYEALFQISPTRSTFSEIISILTDLIEDKNTN